MRRTAGREFSKASAAAAGVDLRPLLGRGPRPFRVPEAILRGRDRLVAWAVAPQESAEELSAFLAGTCPAFYLVPDLLICTSGLPLAGDAVDPDRLAALGRERLESERAARSGPVAPELRRIWEEILGCPAGDEESFFDLGGTSLRLARLLDGVDELYGGAPPILVIRIRLAEAVPAKRSGVARILWTPDIRARMRPGGSMSRRKRRVFTQEQKSAAVEHVRNKGKTIYQAAQDLDLTETALRRWIAEAERQARPAVEGELSVEEREELRRLRPENQRL